MTTSKSGDRRAVLAVCAVALASAVGSGNAAASDTRAIEKLQQYCAASWRNAGIRREEWDDCTQQALLELLEQIRQEGLPTAIEVADSDERRELNRTVWRLVQRWRRAPRHQSFDERHAPARADSANDQGWNQIASLAAETITERQLRILELTCDGWRTAEIAQHLGLTADRVSDEKYKAISKLRSSVAIRTSLA